MDLRIKALYGLICIIIVTSGVLAALSYTFILGNYQELESTYVKNDISLLNSSIRGEIGDLQSHAQDWGAWNDTYAFTQGENPGFVSNNLANTTFDALNVDFIVITDKEGRILFSRTYDPATGKEDALRPDITAALESADARDMMTAQDGGRSGFLSLPGGPVILASYPVLHNDYSGPVGGAVLMGRLVDDQDIRALAGRTNMSVSLMPAGSTVISPADRAVIENGTGAAAIVVRPVGENLVEGQELVRDIYGRDALVLTLTKTRDIYLQGRATILFFTGLQLLALVASGLLMLLFLDRMVLRRMSTLSAGISGITENWALSARVRADGDDEIGRLAVAMNRMLERIAEEHTALSESEERYAAIVNHAPAPIMVLRNGEIFFVNDAGLKASGYPREGLVGKNITGFLTPASRDVLLAARERRRTGGEAISEYEVAFIRRDGGTMDLIVRAIDITFRGEKVTLALLADITEHRRLEESLRLANRKITMLSSITRHDIRNQLLTLRGFLGISREKTADPELLGFIRREERAAEAISRQIEFTKTYEEMGVDAPVWQDVTGLIQSAGAQLHVPESVKIGIDLPPVTIYADRLIEKVFYNLMENALRHGEHVSAIRFSFEETDAGGVIVCGDDGVGIPYHEKEDIFERGFGKNTGLGLFLSREILSITGLAIRECGEPGRGARFEILVPKDKYRMGSSPSPD